MPRFTFKFKSKKDAKVAVKSIKYASSKAKNVKTKKLKKGYSVSYSVPKKRK